jgi:hypothetical protein
MLGICKIPLTLSSLYLCDRIDCPGWMGSLSKNVIFVTNTYLEGEGQRALYRPYLYQHRLWQFVVVLSAVNSGILTAKVRFELIVMCDWFVMQISTFIGKTCSIIAGQIIDERKFLYAGSCYRQERKSKLVSIQIMFMYLLHKYCRR